MKRIVLIAGFESFNADLYRQAAHLASERCPELKIDIFSDRALNSEPDTVEAALQQAEVFFTSLLFYQELVSFSEENCSRKVTTSAISVKSNNSSPKASN